MTAATTARALLVASRPLSWINTAFPFAAAYLLTAGRVDALLVVGTLFFLVPYNLAMYGINDVFDYESDLANPRKGGAEGAVIGRGLHRTTIAAAVLLAVPFVLAIVALLLVGGPAAVGVARAGAGAALAVVLPACLALLVSLFAVVAYSAPPFRFKEVPFLDSATSATHFVSPAVVGLLAAGAVVTPRLLALLAAFFLWGMASHAFGAVQDVVPDREGGIASVATVLGAARTTRFALGAWLLAGLLMLPTDWPGPLAALLVLPYLVAAWPYRSVPDAESARANRGWRAFLAINYACGFLATLLLIWSALLR